MKCLLDLRRYSSSEKNHGGGRFSQRLDNLAPKLDVLQVIHLSKAWDSIPSATISHCWWALLVQWIVN